MAAAGLNAGAAGRGGGWRRAEASSARSVIGSATEAGVWSRGAQRAQHGSRYLVDVISYKDLQQDRTTKDFFFSVTSLGGSSSLYGLGVWA
jgi:hypothetical protein